MFYGYHNFCVQKFIAIKHPEAETVSTPPICAVGPASSPGPPIDTPAVAGPTPPVCAPGPGAAGPGAAGPGTQ